MIRQISHSLFILIAIIFFALGSGSNASEPALIKKNNLKKVTVVITQFVSHDALNAVRDGAVNAIENCAKNEFDVSFEFSNASANALVARQIAQKHASHRPDVIVAISTLSAQSILSAVRGHTPIVFGAITDPEAAQIKGQKVTGVTDMPPFNDQINFVKQILPHVRTIAVLYNPSEDNSRAALLVLRGVFEKLSLNLLPVAVTKAAEINQAVAKISGQADAIFIANDNLIASSFESLVRSATNKNIPVFASDVMLVKRGALGMKGIDYYQTGQQVGMQVCQILNGTDPGDIPMAMPTNLKINLNEKTAHNLGIIFTQDLIQSADAIYK